MVKVKHKVLQGQTFCFKVKHSLPQGQGRLLWYSGSHIVSKVVVYFLNFFQTQFFVCQIFLFILMKHRNRKWRRRYYIPNKVHVYIVVWFQFCLLLRMLFDFQNTVQYIWFSKNKSGDFSVHNHFINSPPSEGGLWQDC